MQRSVCIILLPLFLCTLFGSISLSYCYSDLEDSVLSVSFAVLGLDRNFTVMAPKTMMRGAKRLLEQCDAENRQNQQKIQRICSGEGFVATRTRCNRVDQVKSRRWKTVSYPEIAEVSNSNDQNITAVANENPHMITEGQYSHPFGQASYQRSKQGSIVKYEDSGDNVHECDYCNASFWFGEAVKQSSSNEPIIIIFV
ncbi:hypothetical protein RchiOBHm_Chr4g0402131 [Rosa chinensis]|uniref:Secreted protein n=1 Tax=Rosa chinensis TaxID=74649 RepID=A0A2P6QT80_ROSCH|nr:uncharacterized protein LOC112198336 isoform X1 [Rosa chinensis]PRQ37395.1 hypothetical protein RchiOBHm_Chr4g0402131 [Rosa chinensis]